MGKSWYVFLLGEAYTDFQKLNLLTFQIRNIL
jgi:hypothetical protein